MQYVYRSEGGTRLALTHLSAIPACLIRSIHESDSEGLLLDRVDDRCSDHRHNGRSSAPGVPGLQQPGEGIRSDLGCERMPHLDYRGLPERQQRAWDQQLGLRSHTGRWGLEV